MASDDPKPSEATRREDAEMATGNIPTFLGVSGRHLRVLVSIVCTTGFLLFGYDRECYQHMKKILSD